MQGIVTFRREDLTELVKFVFEISAATVFQAYSAYGQGLRCFGTPAELLADIELQIAKGALFLLYAIHYPDTKGHIEKAKITLNPKKCDGHTWRFSISGWGLIQFQADLRRVPNIECRIAVNSQVRSEAWASQIPTLKDPSLWDWKAVNKRAGQIIRRMKKLAKASN